VFAGGEGQDCVVVGCGLRGGGGLCHGCGMGRFLSSLGFGVFPCLKYQMITWTGNRYSNGID
jgi:hypothetical protein